MILPEIIAQFNCRIGYSNVHWSTMGTLQYNTVHYGTPDVGMYSTVHYGTIRYIAVCYGVVSLNRV